MTHSPADSKASDRSRWSLGQLAALACTWEVCAAKPGNVHRGADFDDVTVGDFLTSGLAITPWIQSAGETSLGAAVLGCVESTRDAVGTNTNLGMVLLLVPLAKAANRSLDSLEDGVRSVLDSLTPEDSRDVYQAINLAQPGGLGRRDSMDIRAEAPEDLLAAMRHASERDRVAKQYVSGFEDVLRVVAPNLVGHLEAGLSLSQAIVHEHIACLSRWGDSLIVRKCGEKIDQRVRHLAGAILESGNPGEESYHQAVSDFDFWLRSDGRRRNPGTTADLICAALFAALVQGQLRPQAWS